MISVVISSVMFLSFLVLRTADVQTWVTAMVVSQTEARFGTEHAVNYDMTTSVLFLVYTSSCIQSTKEVKRVRHFCKMHNGVLYV